MPCGRIELTSEKNNMIIYLNGCFLKSEQAFIHVSDRGLLLGDGVFETLRTFKGKVQFLEAHWKRLQDSLDLLEVPLPLQHHELITALQKLLMKNAHIKTDMAIRITVTRGESARGVMPTLKGRPNCLMTVFPCPFRKPQGTKAIISVIRRNEYSPITKIKSLNYLENVLARLEAAKQEADEALFLNTKGFLTESTTSNIFIVLKGEVLTPQVSDGLLPGIMRSTVLAICSELRLPARETSISPDLLFNACEVFLTNSLLGVQPIVQIDNHVYSRENIFSEKIHDYYLNHY